MNGAEEALTTEEPERLLRMPEVLARIPVSRTTWLEGIQAGKFPQPVRLTARTLAWRERDINLLIRRMAGDER